MWVVLTYDVEAKKDRKALKICRRYLTHVQESVFEGDITEGKLNKLKIELQAVIDDKYDSVIIYEMNSSRTCRKESIGCYETADNII
ncbi:CRISPR-associated endonuclease Cas2 [Butyrivibrio sp. YAB3001]|uniref:CRISPR-associated endonuclease Cas2 n=1 Tax=Butyrivibrio sp. YAB3001 TaxID=1520812 RepID=UPI0008F63BE5|nr:CRISPR-associated endonuclease Cas2 [Butyrivibrio sp. YAB3001]SFB66474.1 CRISPR-associated protein Cas2 [Butyrivibrio sp. YAB3001]